METAMTQKREKRGRRSERGSDSVERRSGVDCPPYVCALTPSTPSSSSRAYEICGGGGRGRGSGYGSGGGDGRSGDDGSGGCVQRYDYGCDLCWAVDESTPGQRRLFHCDWAAAREVDRPRLPLQGQRRREGESMA